MKRRRPRRPTAECEVIPRTECPGGFPSLAKVDQNRLGVLIFDKKNASQNDFVNDSMALFLHSEWPG